MNRFDAAYTRRIQAAVTKAEASSAVEVVVRVVSRSDRYLDVGWTSALVATLFGLGFVLFSPWTFAPIWVVPIVLVFGLGGLGLGWRARRVVRLLTTRDRRHHEVLRGAHASFYEDAVSATVTGTGVLVYCSVLEDEVVLVPDFPAEGKAVGADWAEAATAGRPGGGDLTGRLLAVIDAVGTLGAKVLPHEADDVNELSDAPRIDG